MAHELACLYDDALRLAANVAEYDVTDDAENRRFLDEQARHFRR